MTNTTDKTLYDRIVSVIEQSGVISQYDIEKTICKDRWTNINVHLRTLCESGKVVCREVFDGTRRETPMYSVTDGNDNPFDNISLCEKVLSFVKLKGRISEDYLKNSITEFRRDKDIRRLRKYLAPLIASKQIDRNWGWLTYIGKK